MSDDLARVVGANTKRLRVAAGWTMDDAAARARAVDGQPWATSRWAELEAGRRPITLARLLTVAQVVALPAGLPATALLADVEGLPIRVRVGTGSRTLAGVRAVLSGATSDPSWQPPTSAPTPAADDTERRPTRNVARRLGISPADVTRAAHELWGRPFSDVLDDTAGGRVGQARGHVTRVLGDEIAAHLGLTAPHDE